MKRFFNFLKRHKVTIICILIVLIVISPMLVFFNHTIINTDDFLYGKYARQEYQTNHSVVKAVSVAFDRVKNDYFTWQGTYSSLFMMSLQPDVFSLKFYRVCLFLMFVLSFTSQALAAYTLNHFYLKAKTKYISIILCIYFITITQLMPSIYEAYYWYNGGVHYQFAFSIMCLIISCIAFFTNSKNKSWRVVLFILIILLLFYLGGANYPLGLVFACSFLLFTGYNLINKSKDKHFYLVFFIAFTVFFLFNVLAPGNGVRSQEYENLSLINVALISIRDMIMEGAKWSVMSLVLPVLILLIPKYQDIVKNSKVKFFHPIFAGIVIILLFLSQYVPVIYGLGSKGPFRVENIRFMVLQIVYIIFFINTIGYCYQKDIKIKLGKVPVIAAAIILLCVSLFITPVNEYTSYKMVNNITSGKLAEFTEYHDDMNEKLNDLSIPTEELSFPEDVCNSYLHPFKIYWGDHRILQYYLR